MRQRLLLFTRLLFLYLFLMPVNIDPVFADDKSQAIEDIKEYMEWQEDEGQYIFSRYGMIDRLETFDGYTHSVAVYAVNNCGVDWNEIAYKVYESYLPSGEFVADMMLDTLDFSEEEIEYAHARAFGDIPAPSESVADTPVSEEEFSSADEQEAVSGEETETETEEELIAPDDSDISDEEIIINNIENENEITDKNEQAAKRAESYLRSSAFSESGLIRQLEFEGFTHEQAVYGVNQISSSVDWNEQAEKKAESYLRSSAFSESGLIRQLEFEGFTHDQSVYGASESFNIDWNKQAEKKAESYLNTMAFSEKGLIRQLEFEGFTHEQAVYGVNVIDKKTDWNEQAVKKAKSYLQTLDMSRSRLIHQLEFEGFTHEQAVYGADHAWATPEDMVEVLQQNMENIFPIRSLEDIFTTPMTATYSDVGKRTAVQTSNQDGMRHIQLYANADSLHDYNVITKINAGNLQNFVLSMEIWVNDVFPADQGGCFIGYTNTTTSAVQSEEPTMIGLLVNEKGAGFYNKPQTSDSGSYVKLGNTSPSYKYPQNGSYKLTLVRLTGQTFAYVNDEYIGQYNDNTSGPYQLVYGTSVFNEGDTASCSFDNLAVRKVLN